MTDLNREPWHPSHEPKNFERTDRTGRIHHLESDPEPFDWMLFWYLVRIWIFACICIFAALGVTYWGTT